MKSLMRIGMSIGLILFLSNAVLAQMPGMYPWWDAPIAKDLGLSEEQNQQIRAVVRGSRSQMIQLRAAVDVAEGELKDEMNMDPVDVRKSGDAIEKVIKARADLMRAVSQMSLKLRVILTAAQWQELQKRGPRANTPRMQQRGPGMRRPNQSRPN